MRGLFHWYSIEIHFQKDVIMVTLPWESLGVSREHKAPRYFLHKAPVLLSGTKYVFLSILALTESTNFSYKYV